MRRAFVGLFALACACGGDSTQIIVEISGAEEILNEVTGVRIRVEGRGAFDDFADPPVYVTDTAIPAGRSDFPLEHIIVPLDGDESRNYRVSAQGLVSGATGITVISEARATSGFVDGEVRVLRLFLPGGDCRERTCPVTQTCVQGACRDIAFIQPELLPRRGETSDDAGVDAADASTDASTCEGEGEPCTTESLCEGAVITCSADGEAVCVPTGAKPAATVCRPSTGACDVEELCDGEALECPPDEFADDGAMCDAGVCLMGECGACEPGAECSTGNACELGSFFCEEDGSATCRSAGPADLGTLCREALGGCDESEVCDGTSVDCPVDGFLPDGTGCGEAKGACDLADTCDGSGPSCPDLRPSPDALLCRASTGGCDPAENCDGVSDLCPDDVISELGVECRGAVDECDISEQCDGTSSACPDDLFVPFGQMCGATADGSVCDGSGGCVGLNCGSACATSNDCEIGIVSCNPDGSTSCVPNGFRPSTHICRGAADGAVCDVAETCTGSSPVCPADTFAPASIECRASAGVCDPAEKCTGSDAACPADVKSTTVCRSSSGVCDATEFCNGTSPTCPADGFAMAGMECRAADDTCDIAETCTGTSASCPDDSVKANGFQCRPQGGPCDVAEFCNGTTTRCPTDDFETSGTRCRPEMGDCDVEEVCDGSSATCPADGFLGSSVECDSGDGNNCDAPDFCSGSAPDCPLAEGRCSDLVISEVLPTNTNDGFVELYNSNKLAALVLDPCTITNNLGSSVTLGSTFTLPPGGFFLLSYDESTTGDRNSSLPHPGWAEGQVVLTCRGARIDACGWFTSTVSMDGGEFGDGGTMSTIVFFEGPPALGPAPGSLDSVERLACDDSTAMTMVAGGRDATRGNASDTDNNFADFILRRNEPQTTTSAPELSFCP